MKNLKLFLLIISLVFFLNIVFFSFSYATLYIVKDQEGNNICITNQESLVSKYKALGYIIITIISSSTKQPSEPQPSPTPGIKQEPENKLKADVVFIASNNRLSDSGNYIYIEGIIKNKGKGTAYHVNIKVESFDKYGKLVALNDGYADPYTISPGQESTFQIMVTYDSKISTHKPVIVWYNSP